MPRSGQKRKKLNDFFWYVNYIAIKNFKQDKKAKIFVYGLFLRMNDIDALKLSTVVAKTFLAFYATIKL